MAMNWNPLVILILISGIVCLIPALLTSINPTTKKIRSLFYIRLGISFIAISLILDGISNLFMNEFIAILSAILIFPMCICFSIGINYTIKESYLSIHLIIIVLLGAFLCYFAFQPGAVEPIIENGYQSIIWEGYFGLFTDFLTVAMLILLIYWGFKTWKNAPFLIKKEASLFFLGICIGTILPSIVLLFRTEYHLISNILFYIFLTIGSFIYIYAIIKEPKLLYILPFIIYRILIKDKEGYPLFDHDWSESDISELIFTGFINTVQVMSKEVMNKGGLVDINFEEGMLILHQSKLITVGLIASKSSNLLRDALLNFSKDFEQQFERQLKQKVNDKSEYQSAYLLINKYFSNFPFWIIRSKKQPLLLSGEFANIPFELETKLKEIFTDEEEYKSIIAEIPKFPLGDTEEFLKFYEELKEAMDQLHDNGLNELDDKQDTN